MTEKQKKSSERNWTKALIMGALANLRYDVFTEEEKERVEIVRINLNAILKDWDKNTVELGFKLGKRYNVFFNGELVRENQTQKEVKVFKDGESEGYEVREIR